MELILSIFMGVGLAATCGFRIFVPLLIMGIAGLSGSLNLSSGFEWIASYPAVTVFSLATVVEILAYFFPLVDNLLGTISTPISVLAGIVVTAAVMTDISPFLQWTLAIIAGGGAATATSLLSNTTHHSSTVVSAGMTNPLVSAIESVISVVMAILSIAVPIIMFGLLLVLPFIIYRIFCRFKPKRIPTIR